MIRILMWVVIRRVATVTMDATNIPTLDVTGTIGHWHGLLVEMVHRGMRHYPVGGVGTSDRMLCVMTGT